MSLQHLRGERYKNKLSVFVPSGEMGGMLSAMLLHASVNVTSQFVPLTNASLLVGGIVAILVQLGVNPLAVSGH